MGMTQNTRPTFELSLGEVFLRAPETPVYLALAAQVLEVRRQEIQDGVGVTPPTSGPVAAPVETPTQETAPTQEVTQPVSQSPTPSPTPTVAATPSVRRARWFHDQFPQVTFEDGSTQVIASLDELKELLRNRGLRPHPRGDASMLLWQVRNRLGLTVEQVDRH